MNPQPATRFVSTGNLPDFEQVTALVREAHARFSSCHDGVVSSVYPALARMSSELFGVCVATVDGRIAAAGDTAQEFTIMSVSKAFLFPLVAEVHGSGVVRDRVGVNATGLPFNHLEAISRSADGRTNPMVNPGAIATTSLVPGRTTEEKWDFIRSGLSRFAGRTLVLDEDVVRCARETNTRNREIVALLHARGLLGCDPDEALDLYTRQCCLLVNASDLALMGATLADGGVQPVTRERILSAPVCHDALAVMATAGLYEASGDWLFDVGLPGKSGISGGIVTVSPGKGALGTFAAPLDAAGNSVRGRLAAQFLSQALGLDIFASWPS